MQAWLRAENGYSQRRWRLSEAQEKDAWGRHCFTHSANKHLPSTCYVTHWKRLWCWEGLGAGGKGDDRGWDGWMASPTRRWIWVNSRRWWWTGRPGVLEFMGSQRVGHDWATELDWKVCLFCVFSFCFVLVCFCFILFFLLGISSYNLKVLKI